MTRIAVLCLLLALPGITRAADFSDPTWPCVQRKVERLSIGLMWPEPVDPKAISDNETKAAASELAALLALRRLEVAALEPQVTAYAEAHNGDPQAMGLVFYDVFKSLDARRTRLIKGIGKFSVGQIKLSEKIDKSRSEMDKLMAQDAPDYDKVDALEAQIDWDQTIYSDRQKSITYLCETPTLLEQRLFSVAQLLQSHQRDDK